MKVDNKDLILQYHSFIFQKDVPFEHQGFLKQPGMGQSATLKVFEI